jgi:hypothetical protein
MGMKFTVWSGTVKRFTEERNGKNVVISVEEYMGKKLPKNEAATIMVPVNLEMTEYLLENTEARVSLVIENFQEKDDG